MKTALIIAGILLALYAAYSAVVFIVMARTSYALVKAAVPYALDSSDTSLSLLVLGDSTGVGVGATHPQESVAGRLAKHMGATYVENRAVSGAVVADLAGQAADASLERYDTILIQIGGNDIVRFHDSKKTAALLSETLKRAAGMSERVYLLSAGNVGAAKLFPYPIRPFHTSENMRYHTAFAEVAEASGATYINLYAPPEEDPFTKQPKVYLAADGFHPSGEGYGLWFKRLQGAIE